MLTPEQYYVDVYDIVCVDFNGYMKFTKAYSDYVSDFTKILGSTEKEALHNE